MLKKLHTKHIFLINSIIIASLTVISLAFWSTSPSIAQEDDAIGIQIRKNADSLSALRWYEEIEEDGSPQEMMIDGYNAIRDGRSVYVNAGNLSGSTYYANIYLISYSKDSNPATGDVFAEMLKRWTFNSNLIAEGDEGYCDIPTLACTTNASCGAGFVCEENRCHIDGGKTNTACANTASCAGLGPKYICSEGYCYKDKGASLSCWRDRDCPKGTYCSSKKAKVTRRTVRYENLLEIRTRIMEYFDEEGELPELLAGTYVPGVSISTWPSWNNTLASDIDGGEFPEDPINSLSYCGSNYNIDTCWDEEARIFGGTIASPVNGKEVTGPSDSYFYGYNVYEVYSFSPDGVIRCPLNGEACL